MSGSGAAAGESDQDSARSVAIGSVVDDEDRAAVAAQLGREPRAMRAVGHRCGCGLPDVVETAPRLPDGTPFPTLYYLTCPRASSAIGRLEAGGVMREMTERLKTDGDLAARYRAAHEVYLRRRQQIGDVPEIAGVSAGGMPGRVKCLHVLVAHSLAAGPGINPLGDEALEKLPAWWADGPCVDPAATAGDRRPAARSARAGQEAAPAGIGPAEPRPRPAGPAGAGWGPG